MTDDLRIDRVRGRATERQIVHGIQHIRLSYSIVSDETVHLRRQQQCCLTNVLVIEYREFSEYHFDDKGTKKQEKCKINLVFFSLIRTFAPDLYPINK